MNQDKSTILNGLDRIAGPKTLVVISAGLVPTVG